MPISEPLAEMHIDAELVRTLISRQFPKYAHLAITFLDSGWDNESYRLGADYIVRLPRREKAAALIINETTWLPKLKDKLPIPISCPVDVGKPDRMYPWHWAIVPWFDGETADMQPLRGTEAVRMVQFLKALHKSTPENAPVNLYRGISLQAKADNVRERIKRLKSKTQRITHTITELWQQALQEDFPTNPSLIHGDLHPRNITVNNHTIQAIIDWGDITSGDIATDLSCLWMLFDNKEIRQKALEEYGASKSTITRAIGWAIYFGVVLLDTGLESNERHMEIGDKILKNISNSSPNT